MKTLLKHIIGFFVITLLFIPFELKAQNSENKTQVEASNKRIMLIMPQKPERDSLKIKVAQRDSISRQLRIKVLRQFKKNGKVSASLRKRLKPAGVQKIRASRRTSLWEAYLKQTFNQKSVSFQPPPVRIHTRSLRGNKIAVIIENRTQKTLHSVAIKVNELPEGWSAEPEKRSVKKLPPGYHKQFTFLLNGGKTSRHVGFTLKTGDTLAVYWSARVKLAEPELATGKRSNLPQKFEVYANYPNPFSASTTLTYDLPQPMKVQIEIYNILGQRVATLVNTRQQSGTHNMTWNAADMASGIYFCRMTAETQSGKKYVKELKMVLIK